MKKENNQHSAFDNKTITKAILAMGGNFTSDTLNNLSAYILKNLSADTLKKIKAMWESVPYVKEPYTTLLNDIKEKKRVHNQSTFGPDCDPKENICGTQMCTAGHLVNEAGEHGYALMRQYGWEKAAALIHIKSHPDAPTQNFGRIEQSHAIAYIEMMAAFEQREDKKQKFDKWLNSVLSTKK